MKRVASALLVAGAVLLPIGWILAVESGYYGSLSGGSETMGRVGGLMVLVGGLCLLLAALVYVAWSPRYRPTDLAEPLPRSRGREAPDGERRLNRSVTHRGSRPFSA